VLAKVRVSRVAGGGIEVGASSLHGLPAGATAAAVANSQEISSDQQRPDPHTAQPQWLTCFKPLQPHRSTA
jgi:hypothetical protein